MADGHVGMIEGIPVTSPARTIFDLAGVLHPQRTDRKLIVEIDGDLSHTTLLDQAADARRDEALRTAGYAIVRLKEREVWHQPDEVVRRLLAS